MENMNELNLEEMEQVAGGTGSDKITTEGTVTDLLSNANFKVDIGGGLTITAALSGKLRTNFIRIRVGDRVQVTYTPDIPRGLITWRYK